MKSSIGPCLVLSYLQPTSIRGLVASWTSLLHFLLSLVFFNRSSNGIQVHYSMLTIHRILGFPCFLAPGVVPCIISSIGPTFTLIELTLKRTETNLTSVC